MSSRGPGRLDVFVRRGDGQLDQVWWDSSNPRWNVAERLGGELTSDPAAVSWGSDRADVFMRGVDGGVHHMYWDPPLRQSSVRQWGSDAIGGPSGRPPLNGTIIGGPAVSSEGTNRLDVFVRAPDNQLYEKGWYGSAWVGWSGPRGAPQTITSDPAAVSWGPGRVDVFARGPRGQLMHITEESSRAVANPGRTQAERMVWETRAVAAAVNRGVCASPPAPPPATAGTQPPPPPPPPTGPADVQPAGVSRGRGTFEEVPPGTIGCDGGLERAAQARPGSARWGVRNEGGSASAATTARFELFSGVTNNRIWTDGDKQVPSLSGGQSFELRSSWPAIRKPCHQTTGGVLVPVFYRITVGPPFNRQRDFQ